jgi:glycosyltransferase involved in cell wall biosynthesis
MSELKLASIIISSYNYGRFLREAIDSALDQTYPNVEVIVVDDGSTEIIAGYRRKIVSVLKENGGQASAFNVGFTLSHGEVVCFLDSDDVLLPTAVEEAMKLFHAPDTVKVHWPLWCVDEQGGKTGQVVPDSPLPEGNLREAVARDGPGSYARPPTSGNGWARKFIDRVFPMPETEYKVSPDGYLASLAPLFGTMRRVTEPQGLWRVHGENHTWKPPFDERVDRLLNIWDHGSRALQEHCRELKIAADPEGWRMRDPHYRWLDRLHAATQEIMALIPPGDAFILVDGSQWGCDSVAGRRAIPFLERDGQYWGPPPDDRTAIRELERLRRAGASFILFAWPAFWWLDHYAGLHRHLQSTYRCISRTDRLAAFDLRP